MKAQIIKVTPTLAQDWLKKNTSNRSLREIKVKEIVDDMLAGIWKDNGETIKIARNGVLLDGQHRLQAVVRSKTIQTMLVVNGLEPDVFDTIDIGTKRSGANTLEVRKIPNFNRVAAALAMVHHTERGAHRKSRSGIPPNRILAVLEEYPDLPEAIGELGSKSPSIISRSIYDGLYYLFRKKDAMMALEYMIALRDGIGIETLQAWLALRERLIRNISATTRMHDTHVAALVIKGWNCARNGKDAAKLGWSEDRENFPEIV